MTMRLLGAALTMLLSSCGSGGPADGGGTPTVASSGQVAPAAPAPKVSLYAASRFAEQASFGPTPALVAELQAKGFERWIDEQFALPVSQTDPAKYTAWHLSAPNFPDVHFPMQAELHRLFLSAPDQLRQRVTWGLSQYIVVSIQRADPALVGIWSNGLRSLALGNYADLLYGISTHPVMGLYLDNTQNRPRSSECPYCAPNENYARELMQLFTIGVVKLDSDGSVQRNAAGRPIETYTQRDVEELARVLTGWVDTPQAGGLIGGRNFVNAEFPQIPSTWPPHRDNGAKTVMGRSFPAGQGAEKDLRDAIAMLMAHPNIAPFVSLRIIQHLVKSNPTPAYLARVAAVFRNNGAGVAGDMKAVVKAVLLDAEARAGDTLGRGAPGDGKVREPVLHSVGQLRGLGCQRAPIEGWSGGPMLAGHQEPYNAKTVFSYYAPTDRSPGRNVLAPEQKLMTASEFFYRLWHIQYMLTYTKDFPTHTAATREAGLQRLREAGCNFDELITLYSMSFDKLADSLALRYFRGAMPADLRRELEGLDSIWKTRYRWSDEEIVAKLLTMALAHPAYGAIR